MILCKSAEKARKNITPVLKKMGTKGVILTVKCDDGYMRYVGETMRGYAYLLKTFETPFYIISTLDENGKCGEFNGPTITEKQLRDTDISGIMYDDNLGV